jgi:hypothetical protein
MASRSGTTDSKKVIIDVGSGTIVPTIVRAGKEITPPTFSSSRIDDFLSHATIVPRLMVPVAMSQSIPAGTTVPKGTPVDIVFVPMSSIQFGLLDHVHDDMKALAITNALPVIDDPQVAPILQKASASDVTAAERQVVVDKLKTLNVGIDDTNPAKTFDLAFASLKAAQAFQ